MLSHGRRLCCTLSVLPVCCLHAAASNAHTAACAKQQVASSSCNILGHARTANKLAQSATEQAPGDLLPWNILGRQQEGLVRSWAYPGLKKNGMKNGIFQ